MIVSSIIFTKDNKKLTDGRWPVDTSISDQHHSMLIYAAYFVVSCEQALRDVLVSSRYQWINKQPPSWHLTRCLLVTWPLIYSSGHIPPQCAHTKSQGVSHLPDICRFPGYFYWASWFMSNTGKHIEFIRSTVTNVEKHVSEMGRSRYQQKMIC